MPDTYTLAQIRDGAGWPAGARFYLIAPAGSALSTCSRCNGCGTEPDAPAASPDGTPEGAADAATAAFMDGGKVEDMLAAAAPLMATTDRLRLAEAAEGLAFTLTRPGSGPARDRAIRVVPLAELLALLEGKGDGG